MSGALQKADSFIDANQDALLKVWQGVLNLIDGDDSLPIWSKDEKRGSFSNFVWLLVDEFLNKVRVINDDSEDSGADSVTLSSSEDAGSITEESDSDIHSSQLGSDDPSSFGGDSGDDLSSDGDDDDEEELDQ